MTVSEPKVGAVGAVTVAVGAVATAVTVGLAAGLTVADGFAGGSGGAAEAEAAVTFD